MADLKKVCAPFHAKAAGSTSQESVWQQVWAMISAMLNVSGVTKDQIKAQVDALINSSGLPVYAKMGLVWMANAVIAAIPLTPAPAL